MGRAGAERAGGSGGAVRRGGAADLVARHRPRGSLPLPLPSPSLPRSSAAASGSDRGALPALDASVRPNGRHDEASPAGHGAPPRPPAQLAAQCGVPVTRSAACASCAVPRRCAPCYALGLGLHAALVPGFVS